MSTVITVSCYDSESLRDAIVHDLRLERYGLEVSRQKAPGRNPGWAKLNASDHKTPGAVNLEWDAGTRTLLARVVTRGKSSPDKIVGRFLAYLLARYQRRIRSIHILPD